MAFGDLKGTLNASATSITNPFANAGSVSVSVGDLLICFIAEFAGLTATAVSDNLGNAYTAQNAGTDGGNATGRLFYSIATVGGTLTAQSATATAGTDDVVSVGAVFAGPFAASPVDANPANVIDATTPFSCPTTGTLAQASELVIGWLAFALSQTLTATSPNLMAIQKASAANGTASSVCGAIGYQVVAATTAVIPAFTAGAAANAACEGTISFKAAAATKAFPPFSAPRRFWTRRF